MQTREALEIENMGSLSSLKLNRNVPLTDRIEEGFVRIRVAYVGLNFANVFTVLGLYNAAPPPSFTPGLKCSGIVEAVGAECDRKWLGKRVVVVKRFGLFSNLVDVSSKQIRLVL